MAHRRNLPDEDIKSELICDNTDSDEYVEDIKSELICDNTDSDEYVEDKIR
jgi:hypothetical protein